MDWAYMDLLIHILNRYKDLDTDNNKLHFDLLASLHSYKGLAYMDLLIHISIRYMKVDTGKSKLHFDLMEYLHSYMD